MRLLGPKPNAKSGASAAGVVGGVMALSVSCNDGGEPAGAVGGILLKKAVCGSLPCAYKVEVGVSVGSSESRVFTRLPRRGRNFRTEKVSHSREHVLAKAATTGASRFLAALSAVLIYRPCS